MKPILLIVSFLLFWSINCLAQDFQFDGITSEDGLSHNSVFSIAEDYKGFLWFGTRDGLSRYDGQQIRNYSFRVYNPSIEGNRVSCVYAMGRNLWIGTEGGLFQYSFEQDAFKQVPLGKGTTYVQAIKQVSTGELWVSSQDGIYVLGKGGTLRHILPKQSIRSLCEFRKGTYLILHGNVPRLINGEGETVMSLPVHEEDHDKIASFHHYTLYKDSQGEIWLGANRSVLRLNEQTMAFRPVDWINRLVTTPIPVVRTIIEDKVGNLWIGSESGIIIVNKQHQTIRRYDKSFDKSPYSLTDRAVYSSFVSRDGTVWLGTYFGGVNYARPVSNGFSHLFPTLKGNGLSGKAISQLVEDGQQRIWIATADGGVTIWDQRTDRFSYHNRSNGLSDNNVHSIHIDQSGVAWVGTFLGGLNRIDALTGQKRAYRHNPADSTSLSNNFVCTILRDKKNTLWVGTSRGLNVLDERTGTFRLFRPDILGQAVIYRMLEDTAGQIWIGTWFGGVYRYEPDTGNITHYHADNTPVMGSNQVISLFEDAAHNIWFGTINGGVCQWNSRLNTIIQTPVNNHLPNQTVYGILEDNRGLYWFSTNKGILAFDPRLKKARVFDKSNGLQATQFNFCSSLKDRRGTFYFGSVDGLCYFNPAAVTTRIFDPPVYFTGLKLFNNEVKPDGKLMLSRSLDETGELVFDFDQNVITLEFVAINYFAEHTNYYTYYLEGFEKTWGPKTIVNSQTYTNLSPGTYTFHVRSFRSNGDVSPGDRTIRLIVQPPFWRSTYAYLIYFLLATAVLLLYKQFVTFLNNQKMALQLERVEREKSEGLNKQKLNFFTFLSQEFKAPITLIIAEIDEMMQAAQTRRMESTANYSVIRKNAKRLQSLIEQITELRRTGHNLQPVVLTEADVVEFVKETLHGFMPLLRSRHLRKRFTFSQPYLMASFDGSKLETIISNVIFFLANELPEEMEVVLDVRIDNPSERNNCQLILSFVFDEQPELFHIIKNSYRLAENSEEIFNQADSASINIILTFSLLKLLGGTVVLTEDGPRQVLSIGIPIRKSPVNKAIHSHQKPDLLNELILDDAEELTVENGQPGAINELPASPDKPTLLIIERSRELAKFLKRHYQERYQISVAYSFGETITKAETILPELILCDGDVRDKAQSNLCQTLKNMPRLQSIPIILLLNDEDDKTILEALNSGADGYISKPFNLKELDLMISNQLKAVALLKNQLIGSNSDPLLTTLPKRNKEQEFILRFSALIHQHYKNKEISAETLAQLMNCSRSQLQTKVKTYTGYSTKEYLNEYRLTLARQMLEKGMSVVQATFEAGFSDPNYFGRAFKRKFGMPPSKFK